MTVKQLIEKLSKYPDNTPVTIGDKMDFTEAANDNTIVLDIYVYSTFPYTENDTFKYISLEMGDEEYWN